MRGAVLLGLVAAVAWGAPPPRQQFCGTSASLADELRALQTRREESARAGRGAARAPYTSVHGDLIVMDSRDEIFVNPQLFDHGLTSLVFEPVAGEPMRYRVQRYASEIDARTVTSGRRILLGDDDAAEVELPFAFPFFGRQYRTIFLNSDGNLTFERPDTSMAARNLARFTAGPPRIAPLFLDLDPRRSSGVYVRQLGGGVAFTWLDVPLWDKGGAGALQTFQVVMWSWGAIEFHYALHFGMREVVIGIAPGGDPGRVSFLRPREWQAQEAENAMAERFTAEPGLDIYTAAQRVLDEHPDVYDYLVFFNTLGVDAAPGAIAYALTLHQEADGIGRPVYDLRPDIGLNGTLKTLINMGPLRQYPEDPTQAAGLRPGWPDDALTILTHEAGHLSLAFPRFRVEEGFNPYPLLASDGAHWSHLLETDASIMDGGKLAEVAPGRFRVEAVGRHFSALDLYFWGMLPASETPGTFWVEPGEGEFFPGVRYLLRVGEEFGGNRRDVSIDEIIAQTGARLPGPEGSQRTFRFAFVVITADGNPPAPGDLEKLERIRTAFPAFFHAATQGHASARTELGIE